MSKIVRPVMGFFTGNKAINTATNRQVEGNQDAQRVLDPYMQTGTQANTMLQNQLSSGQLGGNFTPGDLTNDPGYKFRLAQGEQALGRRQSAGGNVFSGQALKEALEYSQGLADQTYNDAYNRWLQQQQNTYNILSGQQGQGQQAATNYGGYATNIGNAKAQGIIAKENNRNKTFGDLSQALGGGMLF